MKIRQISNDERESVTSSVRDFLILHGWGEDRRGALRKNISPEKNLRVVFRRKTIRVDINHREPGQRPVRYSYACATYDDVYFTHQHVVIGETEL